MKVFRAGLARSACEVNCAVRRSAARTHRSELTGSIVRRRRNPLALARGGGQAVLNDSIQKQEWYKDFLYQENPEQSPLAFIGRFTPNLNADVKVIVNDIIKTINFDRTIRGQYTKETFFAYLSALLEKKGILVMKSGIVGNNTSRVLNAHEFRGFAIADKYAPLIFVNGADSPSAQLFTLMHEVAHLWLGKSGVSDINPNNNNDQLERLCNQIAAEFLVPAEEFTRQWQKNLSTKENLTILAKHFLVSRYVIAIKALQLNYLSSSEWQDIFPSLLTLKKQTQGSGNAYNTIPVRNSKRFTQAVIQETMNKNILIREGAQLLNITPQTLMQLYRKGGVNG